MDEFVTAVEREVSLRVGDVSLEGTLVIPETPVGIVLFAHGSGSSRFSRRNRYVAEMLNEAGLATLLFDLLTREEHEVDQFTREFRFDIGRLAERLVGAVEWVREQRELLGLGIGLFGASTGAAAALMAAARRPQEVAAVVSRGGRPDLAGAFLGQVRAPTLLLVGGYDEQVLLLNRQAARALEVECELSVVPGATHLFEEPGKLEEVARLARQWFTRHLAAATVR